MTVFEIDFIFERSCLSKANLTEEEANLIVDKVLINENKMLYYYKCDLCSSIHLTSKEPTNFSPVVFI